MEDEFDVVTLSGRRASRRWERVSVGDIFERLRWSYPDKEAIVALPGCYANPAHARITYEQADALANRFAQALVARGLQRGDRVLMICENSVEAYVAKIAIVKAGGVCAPINPSLGRDAREYIIGLVEPRLAVVDAEFHAANEPLLHAAGLGGVVIPIGGPMPSGDWVEFDVFVDGMPDAECDATISGDDVWEIIFTSGTTAWPKGAMITHTGTYLAAYCHGLTHSRGLRFETDMRMGSLLPLIYHAADQSDTLPAFLCGGTLIMGRRLTGPLLADAITRERITAIWAGSPQLLKELVTTVDADPLAYDLSSLTSITWAWAALPPALGGALKRICGSDVQLVSRLGQTEAISTTRFWPEKWRDIYQREAPERNFVGVPCPILAAGIMDEKGVLLDPRTEQGVPGEVVYRSPTNMAGYYRNEDATRAVFRDGWLHSGDSCEYEDHHLLVMKDRFKDMVKSGGENVSSQRVEAAVLGCPGVAEVAVVGLPHERWGEAVTAFVIPQPGATVDAQTIIDHCRIRLARFEVPKQVVFVEEFPRTVGRKILKYSIREQYQALYESGVPSHPA